MNVPENRSHPENGFEAEPSAPRYPTIGVVIPLYNHAAYIDEALHSVLAQDSPCDEILVLDDGSVDDGCERARKVLANLPWARVLSQANMGAHATINRAISMTSSDYIAVLNSDDAFLPNKIDRCRRKLQERPATVLLYGGVQIMDADSQVLSTGHAVEWLLRARTFLTESSLHQLALLNENFAATTSNMVFSRRLWRAAGGFQNLRYCHDLDFLMFAYGFGEVHFDADHEHIRYRVHAGNTIAENLGRIRIELASVIAEALQSHGGPLLGNHPSPENVKMFLAFLANKRMSNLLCLFQSLRAGCSDRTAFYSLAASPELLQAFGEAILQ